MKGDVMEHTLQLTYEEADLMKCALGQFIEELESDDWLGEDKDDSEKCKALYARISALVAQRTERPASN